MNYMFTPLIQTGGGSPEREGKPIRWPSPPYVGKGRYILYPKPDAFNQEFAVFIDKHISIDNAFYIGRYGDDLEVKINGQSIFSKVGTTELQEGVSLSKRKEKWLIMMDEEAWDLEILIFHKKKHEKDDGEDEHDGEEEGYNDDEEEDDEDEEEEKHVVARAKLAYVSHEQAKAILENEMRIDTELQKDGRYELGF